MSSARTPSSPRAGMRCGSHSAAARNASAGTSGASRRHGRSRGSANVDDRSSIGELGPRRVVVSMERQQQAVAAGEPVGERDDFGRPIARVGQMRAGTAATSGASQSQRKRGARRQRNAADQRRRPAAEGAGRPRRPDVEKEADARGRRGNADLRGDDVIRKLVGCPLDEYGLAPLFAAAACGSRSWHLLRSVPGRGTSIFSRFSGLCIPGIH